MWGWALVILKILFTNRNHLLDLLNHHMLYINEKNWHRKNPKIISTGVGYV